VFHADEVSLSTQIISRLGEALIIRQQSPWAYKRYVVDRGRVGIISSLKADTIWACGMKEKARLFSPRDGYSQVPKLPLE